MEKLAFEFREVVDQHGPWVKDLELRARAALGVASAAVWTKRSSRQTSILGAVTVLFAICTTLLYLWPAPGRGRFILSREGRPVPKIEIEGLQIGAPFEYAGLEQEDESVAAWVGEEFSRRVVDILEKEPAYPTCDGDVRRFQRTAIDPRRKFVGQRGSREAVISIAIDLHSSEAIIPALSSALLTVVGEVIEHNKVFISIFENASEDKTADLLSELAAALYALGVDGLWVHSSKMMTQFWTEDRLVVLSELRNVALHPLLPYATNSAGKGTLVFINDVVTCASDILEVIHQQRLQQADMAASVDWGTVRSDEEAPQTRIYDMWVLRGANGELPFPFEGESGYQPRTPNGTWALDAFSAQEPADYTRWLDGRPFPVYSAWGGMVAIDASLFTDQHLRFRAARLSGWHGGSADGALGDWGRLLSLEGYLDGDCPGASECKLFARDIWNLRDGRARMVLASQARTTYSVDDWELMRVEVPRTNRRDDLDLAGQDLIDWRRVQAPEMVVCIPTRDDDGMRIEEWDEGNVRKKLPPLWKANGTMTDGG